MPKYSAPKQEFINYSPVRIPREVACTGDEAMILNCLRSNPGLTQKDTDHLTDRLNTMRYVDELVKEQNLQKHLPPKAIPTGNGLRLPELPEEQQTSACGCWAMPLQMMLKSRGIEIPQEVIRTYRPRMSAAESRGMADEDIIQLNADVYSNSAWGAELVQRLLPNTAMKQKSYGTNEMKMTDDAVKLYRDDLKKSVTQALSLGSPVALLVSDHYRTVVGIEGDELILKDSLKPTPVPEERLSIGTLFADAQSAKKQAVEITWLDDLRVEKGSVSVDYYLNRYPYITRNGNTLSISEKNFSALQAGVNNPLADDNYEDEKVFHSALSIGRVTSTAGSYICTRDILPKALDPNVRELAPAVGAPQPEKAEDPEQIIPEAGTPGAINDVPEDSIEAEKPAPEKLDHSFTAPHVDPLDTSMEDTEDSFLNQTTEYGDDGWREELFGAQEEKPASASNKAQPAPEKPMPAAQAAEPLNQASGAQGGELDFSFSKPTPAPKAEAPAETIPEPLDPAFERINAAIAPEAAKPAEQKAPVPEIKKPAEQKAPAPEIKKPAEQKATVTDAAKPTEQKAPVPDAKKPAPEKEAPATRPAQVQPKELNAMLDREIAKYKLPQQSYFSKFMREDMYPPKPSMVKELCKAFGSGLLNLVRGVPILGPVVGFFADIVGSAIKSYDRMMEAIDAKKPFMAGESVYNMAMLNAARKAQKNPETAAFFADPNCKQIFYQLAVNDPDLNYAATRNHSPEFYRSYLMDQKGFNKLSENYTKRINDIASNWPEYSKKIAEAQKAAYIQRQRALRRQQQQQRRMQDPNLGQKMPGK